MVNVRELPIYQTCCVKIQTEDKLPPEGYLEPYVRDARKEACSTLTPILGDYPKQARELIDNAIDFNKSTIAFVRKEENIAARAAFITGSTFLGLMLARRGIFRRLTFATLAASGAAATCNPQAARDYANVGCTLAKQTANDLYQQNKDSLSLDALKKLFDDTTGKK